MSIKFITVSIGMLCITGSALAQYVVSPCTEKTDKPVENGIYYSLPQNYFKIQVEVEETHLKRGIYSDYAEQLLKLNSIKEDQTIYRISNIHVQTLASPDPEQVFAVYGNRLPSMELSPDGLLKSVNRNLDSKPGNPIRQHTPIPPHHKEGNLPRHHLPGQETDTDMGHPAQAIYTPVTSVNVSKRFDTLVKRHETDTLLIVEKILQPRIDEKSLFEQAQKVADRILKIQTDQSDLLSGLQEVAYPEGTMEFMYRQLEKNERQYLECFSGTIEKKVSVHEFYLYPVEGQEKYAIAFFSAEEGIEKLENSEVNQYDSDNDLLIVQLQDQEKWGEKAAAFHAANHTPESGKGFFYRIPAQVQASVQLNGNELFRQKVAVAQWGNVMNLPVREGYVLKLDKKTGAIRYFGLPQGTVPSPGKKK